MNESITMAAKQCMQDKFKSQQLFLRSHTLESAKCVSGEIFKNCYCTVRWVYFLCVYADCTRTGLPGVAIFNKG